MKLLLKKLRLVKGAYENACKRNFKYEFKITTIGFADNNKF